MAGGAICWKLPRHVVGVGRLIKIRRVATRAGVGRVVVVAVVAGVAIVGNGAVGPVQRVHGIVVVKSGRFPADGGVAGRTVGRHAQRRMVRINALVVIRRVTTGATGGCPGISRSVARDAIGGLVYSRQRELGIAVVKRIIRAAIGVTNKAGRAVV